MKIGDSVVQNGAKKLKKKTKRMRGDIKGRKGKVIIVFFPLTANDITRK